MQFIFILMRFDECRNLKHVCSFGNADFDLLAGYESE